eukprot:TRINITY_DN2561_c0_g1_i3.p1 TRINITY_DN2561_c0_g1~~TRINITY_DN2561_c0_g1_i3.p1  ORF type:complete len:233 (+),score=70.79 TRINITY_DN2561_c0_g1_i3:123-821(+)
MIIRIVSDSGTFLSDKEVVSIDAKRNFGTVLGSVREKLQVDSLKGFGLWVADATTRPPIPWLPVERTDTPSKLGIKQGDVLFVRKETAKERKQSIVNTQILRDLKAANPKEYKECIQIFSRMEASRQRSARRIYAMNLHGTEWRALDPVAVSPSLDCPICTRPLSQHTADPVQLEACAHAFHEECLLAWIGTGSGLAASKCPICRARIKSKSLDPFSSDDDDDDPMPLIRAS